MLYSATDSVGRNSTANRTLNVVNHNINPTITLQGQNSMTVAQSSTFVEPGYSAIDALGSNVNVVVTGNVDTNIASTYTLTYTATDTYNNTSTVTRLVTVSPLTETVECLTGLTVMNIQSNKLVLNYTGTETYNANKKYGLAEGIYRISGIDNDHPIAIIPAANSAG